MTAALCGIVIAMLRFLGVALIAACGGTSDMPKSDAAVDSAPPCMLGSNSTVVATLAGCEQAGTTDGTRDVARFSNPVNVTIAGTGLAYVTDFDDSRVRAVDVDGRTHTIVQRPDFVNPFGLVRTLGGQLYVETDDDDMGQHSTETGTIWRVDPSTGDATVIARDIGRPRGLAVLSDGRIAFADHQHHVVGLIDPATGTVTPLAGQRDMPGYANGTGTAAQFAQPYDIVILPTGELVVTELDNHRLRKITLAGTVTDFAGTGAVGNTDGAVNAATFDAPQGLAIDTAGTLYVTDIHQKVIRRIRNNVVQTIAGDGTAGFRDADDPKQAQFYGLEGIDVRGARLIVSDGNIGDGMPYNRIRVIRLDAIP